MKSVLFLLIVSHLHFIRTIDSAGAPKFLVNVTADGSYNVQVNGVTWLSSGDTAFNGNGKTFSTSDHSLQLTSQSEANGADQFGQWTSTRLIYLAGGHTFNATIKRYTDPNLSAAIFTQTYVDAVTKTATLSSDNVISKFPSFKLQTSESDLGFLAFAGLMAGYTSMASGRYNKSANFPYGIKGGPLVLFDNSNNAIIISPLSKFFAASSSIDHQKQVNWGIMGLVDDVPRGYSVDFIVYYSNQGINDAIHSWGNYLTRLYQKSTVRRDSDFTVKYLGYWTDNGAYYYYHTETNKTYETTILDTVDHFNNLSIPFKYLQYDSWWYPKGNTQGVTTWTSMSSVFPHGIKYISDKTKLPIGCHNRYWDKQTPYAKYNGGPYNFIPDNVSGYAVPDDINFWNYLFNETRKWGNFILYEQDWLDVETEHNVALKKDLFLGQRWLLQMGEAADRFGPIDIQYCMAYSRHMLQSLEIPAVTQARVSNDYHPGGKQWDIGITSIFADALNVAPFKDTFFSSTTQPGNPYGRTEPNAELQAAIATLSTGPVGPGDGINFFNKNLIMKCCDTNGLILKPAKPATAIDDQIKKRAFHGSYPGPAGEVYTTNTVISGFFFGIVLAAELTNEYQLTPASAWPTVKFPASRIIPAADPSRPVDFSNSAPIKLDRNCTTKNFCLYYTSPLFKFDNGDTFVILGELNKWVPMSHQRVSSIQTTGTDFIVQLVVQARETVNFTYYSVSKSQVKTVMCDNSKKSTPALSTVISIAQGTCTVN